MQFTIVGWGVQQGDEKCHFCGGEASVYVDGTQVIDHDEMMVPACKKCTASSRDIIAEKFQKIFG